MPPACCAEASAVVSSANVLTVTLLSTGASVTTGGADGSFTVAVYLSVYFFFPATFFFRVNLAVIFAVPADFPVTLKAVFPLFFAVATSFLDVLTFRDLTFFFETFLIFTVVDLPVSTVPLFADSVGFAAAAESPPEIIIPDSAMAAERTTAVALLIDFVVILPSLFPYMLIRMLFSKNVYYAVL